MPYDSIRDLPDSVKENIPKHAREIYMAAFNSAWEEYGHQEVRAHKVAWAAVKNDYQKNEETGKWEKKD